MGVEGGVTKLADLNPSWPLATDDKNQGDDHLRNIKAALASLIPDGLVVPYGLVQLGFPAVWAAGNLFQVDSDGISLKTVAPSALTGINADKVDGQDAAEFAAASHTHSHTALTDKGVKTHAEIDTHVVSTSNPHSVTANQVLPAQTGNSGKYLKTDGANSSWAALAASGGLLRTTVYNAAGSYTWTKGAGTTKVKVVVTGGGGNGSLWSGAPPNEITGGGGGAGGTAIKTIDVSAISSVAVTVGAASGTSSFGAHCSASGGATGVQSCLVCAAGGVGSNGDLNLRGEGGETSIAGRPMVTTGGISIAQGGRRGGNSYWGGAGHPANAGALTGLTGSGGAGSGADYAYGTGGPGLVVVEEYS